MGATKLRKIQMGVESTAGTAVPATYIWRGQGVLTPEPTIEMVPEQIGHHVESDRSGKTKIAAMVAFEPTPLSPENAGHILSSAIKDVVTGTADGAGSSGYTYNYAWTNPRTANSIKFRTIEGVTAQQTKEMEYSFVESFTVTGDASGWVTIAANWRGRQATNVTQTTLTTITDVNDMTFGANSLFIDDGGGTIGSTEVSTSIIGFTLTVNTGWVPFYTLDQLYFTTADYVGMTGALQVRFKHNSTAITEETAYTNETARLVRLDLLGEAYGTAGSGTLFSGFKGVRIDVAGKFTQFDSIESQDGNDIISATLPFGYNTTDDQMLDITVANELASLP